MDGWTNGRMTHLKRKRKQKKKEGKKERKPLIVDKKAGLNRPMRRHREFLVHDLMALIINVK